MTFLIRPCYIWLCSSCTNYFSIVVLLHISLEKSLKHVNMSGYLTLDYISTGSTISKLEGGFSLSSLNPCTYVTGPAEIGHICTQNFALFFNFHLQYLLKYKSYDNEILMVYLHINKKTEKFYRTWISLAQTKKNTIFWSCVICADMPSFRRPSHICIGNSTNF